MKIAEEIKKCNFNISEKKKVFIKYIKIYIFQILDILEQDSLRNKNKSDELMNKMKKNNKNQNNSYNKTLIQQSKGNVNDKYNHSNSFSSKRNIFNIHNNLNTNDNDNYDYENEDLNNHIEQSSYDEYYESNNYSVHNFDNEYEN